jgi:osmotically inducible lipoprotein OsmB
LGVPAFRRAVPCNGNGLNMTKRFATIGMVLSLLALTACGTRPGERAVSGAGIGAATGAVAGAILGGPVLGAALLGGAVGAATGAVTSNGDINLGKPIWKR